MMKLGTTGAFGFDDFPQPAVLRLYADAGCSIVQVYRNVARGVTVADIRALLADLPMTVDSLHGIFGDDLDPSSEDETMRRKTIDAYQREADVCRDVGGDMVVVHPSPANAPAGNLDRRYAQLRRSMDDLSRIGASVGTRFGIENMPPYHPVGNDPARLVREVAAAASPHVIFVLDTGHAHMTGGIADAVRAAGPHLAHTHVHDNDGVNDTHRLPYCGTLPWDECRAALHEIKYNGVFLFEVFETPDDLRRLLTPQWKANVRAITDNGIA